MRKSIMEIKQKHIDNGIFANTMFNPVALAIKEIFPNNKIYVDWRNYEIEGKTELRKLPEIVHLFMKSFYEHKQVYPFSFELEI